MVGPVHGLTCPLSTRRSPDPTLPCLTSLWFDQSTARPVLGKGFSVIRASVTPRRFDPSHPISVNPPPQSKDDPMGPRNRADPAAAAAASDSDSESESSAARRARRAVDDARAAMTAARYAQAGPAPYSLVGPCGPDSPGWRGSSRLVCVMFALFISVGRSFMYGLGRFETALRRKLPNVCRREGRQAC
jgi:hypothetical protein